MSFTKPYQKSTGKTVHRASRKARFSATRGFLLNSGNRRLLESKRRSAESKS